MYITLPHNEILDFSKLKAFANNKFIEVSKINFADEIVGIIVGKGENAGCQHFLLFTQCFQKLFFLRSLKCKTVW